MPARASTVWTRVGSACGGAVPSRARLARLLDRIDPRLRRLLGGGTDVRRLLLHKGVEGYIAHSAGLGDHVPFDGLHGIGLQSAPNSQNVGETVLSDGISFVRRFPQQRRR